MEKEKNLTEKVNYDVLRHQLVLLAKEFNSCSGVIEKISEIKDKKSFQYAYSETYAEICNKFGIELSDEDDVEKLEDKIDDLEDDICKLENEIDEYQDRFGVIKNSLTDEFKVNFFIQYSKEYTAWEVEQLFKDGRRLLSA
jgi:predicted  nucleic acid-binding Zn-ribbon protein